MYTNYSDKFENSAVLLPSVSLAYSQFAYNGQFSRINRIKATDLNFFDPENPFFFYPYALYSATNAAKNQSLAQNTDNIFHHRKSLDTCVVCDSGGFSVVTSGINYYGQDISVKGEPLATYKTASTTVKRIFDWGAAHGNFLATLDFPLWAIQPKYQANIEKLLQDGASRNPVTNMGRSLVVPPMKDIVADIMKHNIWIFEDDQFKFLERDANEMNFLSTAFLTFTLYNNQVYYEQMKGSETNVDILNVVHGTNETEAKIWWDAVKGFPFTSLAFGGKTKDDFGILLEILIEIGQEANITPATLNFITAKIKKNKIEGLRSKGVPTILPAMVETSFEEAVDESKKMKSLSRLRSCNVIHMFGVGDSISRTIAYSCLQRHLNRYFGSDVQITYDSANSILDFTDRGKAVVGFYFDGDWKIAKANPFEFVRNNSGSIPFHDWVMIEANMIFQKAKATKFHFAYSNITKDLLLCDPSKPDESLLVIGEHKKKGLGPIADNDSIMIMENHNIQCSVEFHRIAEDDFKKHGFGSSFVKMMDDYISDIFSSDDPMSRLQDLKVVIRALV